MRFRAALPAVLLGLLFLAAALPGFQPVAAQVILQQPVRPAPQVEVPVPAMKPEPVLSPEQEEALHQGMLEVRQLDRQGDRAGAIKRAEALLKQFPASRRVENVLLDFYRAEDRQADLVKLLRTRAQRDPNDVESTRDLVALLLAAGDNSGAIEALKKFVAASPKDETRYRLAASLLSSRDQRDAAIQFYRQGRDAIGEEILFAPELAQLEMERGDTAAAVAEYMLLATDPERRARVWREVSTLLERTQDQAAILTRIEAMRRKNPKSVAIQDIAAMTFVKMGRYREAMAAVQEADRYAEDQGEHLLDFARQTLEGASADSLALERAKIGLEALQLLSERHPNSNLLPESTRLAVESLVTIARVQSDRDEQRTLLGQAVQIIDTNSPRITAPLFRAQLQALKGLIYLEDLDRPAEALAIFQEVAAQQRAAGDPDHIARVQIARCEMALGKLDDARRELEAMAKADSTPAPFPGRRRRPEPKQIGLSRARYYLAELDLIAGKYEEARTGFTTLAEQAPEDRLANDCLDLAMTLDEAAGEDPAILQRYGAYRRALLVHDDVAERTELESLVREAPSSALAPIALQALGELAASELRYDEALTQYETLLTKYPKHRLAPRALESIGDLQAQAFHRPDLAVQAYEQLLVDYPNALFLDGVRKKLVGARAAVRGGTHATP